MSLPHFLLPLKSSSTTVFKFASSAASSTSRSCARIPRNFSSTARTRLSSKRELQTAAAYRPHTLEPPPVPPRNSGIPDTSIAGGIPQVNDTRPPQLDGERVTVGTQRKETSTFSVPENEAQKSKPITTSTSSAPSESPSPSPTKPKRSKLRPRKAAMSLTPSAMQQLHNLLSQPEPKLIRVGVKNRGCSGLAYHLEYVDKPGAFDETVEQDGIKVLIDSKALFSIIGSEMDWVEDKLNRRFVFRNPNISESPSHNPSWGFDGPVLTVNRGAMRMWRVFHGLVLEIRGSTITLESALYSIGIGVEGICSNTLVISTYDRTSLTNAATSRTTKSYFHSRF